MMRIHIVYPDKSLLISIFWAHKPENAMSKDQPEQKRKRGRPVKYVMPDKVDATPEQLAKAILSTPPKKPQEWEFMKDFEGDASDLEG